MSTRKGNFVTLEEVLELTRSRVREILAGRVKPEYQTTPAEQEQIAEIVAIGAVVFHELSTDPARDVEFDVERVVDFVGETGPYVQYAHTRCLSVIRKAGATPGSIHFDPKIVARLGAPEELALIKTLGQFPLHLERTLRFSKASQLAHALIDTTKAFGAFYRECHVVNPEDPDLTRARLMLVESTRRVLSRGCALLGVPLPQKM